MKHNVCVYLKKRYHDLYIYTSARDTFISVTFINLFSLTNYKSTIRFIIEIKEFIFQLNFFKNKIF